MPKATMRIVQAQRDAIYEQVRNHLGAIGDLWTALETDRDYATAERLAIEFSEEFRLMADLGWDPGTEREIFELTMPVHDLIEAITRLREEACAGIAGNPGERSAEEEDASNARAFKAARVACDQILMVAAGVEARGANGCRA